MCRFRRNSRLLPLYRSRRCTLWICYRRLRKLIRRWLFRCRLRIRRMRSCLTFFVIRPLDRRRFRCRMMTPYLSRRMSLLIGRRLRRRRNWIRIFRLRGLSLLLLALRWLLVALRLVWPRWSREEVVRLVWVRTMTCLRSDSTWFLYF